jgi:hypothetical protein
MISDITYYPSRFSWRVGVLYRKFSCKFQYAGLQYGSTEMIENKPKLLLKGVPMWIYR